MKIVLVCFLYEIWRIKQWFSKNSYGIFVVCPELVGFVQIKPESYSEEIYYSRLIFQKAFDKKEVFLNKNKGLLKINWLNLNVEAVFDISIPSNEWKNFDLDF